MKILITQERIQKRVKALARKISNDYRNLHLICVGVLKGSFIFMSDLVRQINVPLRCDFLRVSSYDTTVSSGIVKFDLDLSQPITDENVLLIEDIIDTGRTLKFLLDNLKTRKPRSLKVCSLLFKAERSILRVDIDYLGFKIPNKFVVGYGLDYKGKYRNLPYLATLEKEDIS